MALTTAAIWGVTQWMEEISLFHPLSVTLLFKFKQKLKVKKKKGKSHIEFTLYSNTILWRMFNFGEVTLVKIAELHICIWTEANRSYLHILKLKHIDDGSGVMAQLPNPPFASTRHQWRPQFMFQLLHFPHSSLLVVRESSGGWLKAYTHVGDLDEIFWLLVLDRLITSDCGHLRSDSVNVKSFFLSLLYKSAVPIRTNKSCDILGRCFSNLELLISCCYVKSISLFNC